jgi:hypothetical protein
MGYNIENVKNYFMELNEVGRNYYINKFHSIDTIYPAIYFLFYITTLSYLIKKLFTNNKTMHLFLIIPTLGIISDYGENILINNMMKNYDNISEIMVNISSSLTIVKFIMVYISLMCSIVFLLIIIITKINNRIRRNCT